MMKLSLCLPCELIVEILSWLPVKDLLRLKVVCKYWNIILSDVTFIKLHLRRSASRNPHLLLQDHEFSIFKKDPKIVPIPVSHLVENSLTTLPDGPRYSSEKDRLVEVVGSCNGLICLCGYVSPFEAYLRFWNPATRLITENLGAFRLKGIFIRFIFGYDNLTDAFKVVMFYQREEETAPARIFTLGCNIWRDAKNLLAGDIGCYDHKSNDGVLNLTGTLNWLASHPDKQSVIVSFHLGTETFTQFSLPPNFAEKNPFVGVLMDCLSLSHIWNRTHYVIWQMKEFGDEKSWTQLLKINFQDPLNDSWFPLCFYNGDTLILARSDSDDEGIVHNGDKWILVDSVPNEAIFCTTGDNKAQRIGLTWHFATGYAESLVSPYGKVIKLLV